MKTINYLNISIVLFLFAFTPTNNFLEQSKEIKTHKKNQINDWEILFDGSGIEKWRSPKGASFPVNQWKIENGLLFLESKEGRGGIITKEKYSDFELVFEFNLTEGANNGVKYFVDTLINCETGKARINGPEYQIIDDYNHKYIKNNPNSLSSTASAYLLYAPRNKKLNPHGQWNKGRIIAKNNRVQHWLNGVKVVSYKRGSKDFLKRKAKTKFKNYKNYGEFKSGHILLTDHNDKVYFRNIKIRRL